MLILPPKSQCGSFPLHLPSKPSPIRYTTARIHLFHFPTTRPFSWLGFKGRSLRLSPLLNSLAPQLLPREATGSAEDFKVELCLLLALLPEEMQRRVSEHPELHDLIEVVMDLGRKPLARFPSGDFVLSDHPITMEDILHATSQVRWFSALPALFMFVGPFFSVCWDFSPAGYCYMFYIRSNWELDT